MRNFIIPAVQNGVKLLLLLTLFSSCSKEMVEQEVEKAEVQAQEQERYILVYNDDAFDDHSVKFPDSYPKAQEKMKDVTRKFLQEVNLEKVEIGKVYSHTIKGAVLKLNIEQLEELQKRKAIKYIEKDRYEMMAPPCGKGNRPPCEGGDIEKQQVPYGVTRVGGIENYTGDNVAWIIDSGIDIDHPDLNVDASRGYRAPDVYPHDLEHPFDDDNGHGTHVAGTVAAINNDIGVIGVAPGATVIPIKVLGANNYGWRTDIIAGVDYVAAHAKPGDVVNMSLGGGAFQATDDAVLAASEKGIWFTLAAMNNSDDANLYSPARVNGEFIITVSAMDENDNWAGFSNYGNPPIDFAGPGVMVLSTFPDGNYIEYSGTSMAAPHAAGVILIGGSPSTDGTFVKGDPDAFPDPVIAYVPEPCEPLTWYKDLDNDSYGADNPETNIMACEQPADDYVLTGGDCNDNDASVYPGNTDICKDCDPGNDEDCEATSAIELSATGYKVKGVWHADLSWNYSGTVEIYREGEIVATIDNSSGTYTDVTGFKGGGSLTYKVCEAGTNNCSPDVTVQF